MTRHGSSGSRASRQDPASWPPRSSRSLNSISRSARAPTRPDRRHRSAARVHATVRRAARDLARCMLTDERSRPTSCTRHRRCWTVSSPTAPAPSGRRGAALPLPRSRAADAGIAVTEYYGAAELSFVAAARRATLRAFPGVEVDVRSAPWRRDLGPLAVPRARVRRRDGRCGATTRDSPPSATSPARPGRRLLSPRPR